MRKLKRKKISLVFVLIVVICLIIFYNYFFINNIKNGRKWKRKSINILNSLQDLDVYIQRGYSTDKSNTNFYFSVNTSDKIGGYRKVPDSRSKRCYNKSYLLPERATVSVIIVYYNEARSTLIRTITSVLQNTPTEYLTEILLIDDFNVDVTQGIDLQFLPLIKLIRNKQRLGVIESRNIGAKIATGEYITFLDSHCEVNNNWIEPLLARLSLYPGVAVSPVLDIIDANSFQYKATKAYLKGGFDWNLKFNWIPMTEEERESRSDESDPFTSPVFSGGIFMISKKWFLKLNGFNPLLKVWGGESIEMSIKLWLCGGTIEIVPCSRIGHVFTEQHSFDFPDGNYNTYLRNSKVIAESWLEEYKYFFYSSRPKAKNLLVPDTKPIRVLQNDLQCRPFSWYLQVVFSEMKLPNEEYVAFGKITSGNKCLSVDMTKNDNAQKLTMKNCQDVDVTNWSLHAVTGKLSTELGACLNVEKDIVVLQYCKGKMQSQRWIRDGEKLIHKDSKLCLDNYFKDLITVSYCRRGNPSQLFSFSVELQKL